MKPRRGCKLHKVDRAYPNQTRWQIQTRHHRHRHHHLWILHCLPRQSCHALALALLRWSQVAQRLAIHLHRLVVATFKDLFLLRWHITSVVHPWLGFIQVVGCNSREWKKKTLICVQDLLSKCKVWWCWAPRVYELWAPLNAIRIRPTGFACQLLSVFSGCFWQDGQGDLCSPWQCQCLYPRRAEQSKVCFGIAVLSGVLRKWEKSQIGRCNLCPRMYRWLLCSTKEKYVLVCVDGEVHQPFRLRLETWRGSAKRTRPCICNLKSSRYWPHSRADTISMLAWRDMVAPPILSSISADGICCDRDAMPSFSR